MIHQKQQASSSSQSGFTIIESLVAIVVIGILLAAIAPVIVFSVATRVQARRIELATTAAKTYIDGVRSRTINPPPTTGASYTLNNYPAPLQGSLSCNANAYCTSPSTDLYCIDGDGSGCNTTSNKDFVIQAFRYNQVSANTENGYQLGLRVYRADAFNKTGITLQALKDPKIKQAQTFTAGTGLTSRQAPLVETTTEISSKATTFNDFCARLKSSGGSNSQSNC